MESLSGFGEMENIASVMEKDDEKSVSMTHLSFQAVRNLWVVTTVASEMSLSSNCIFLKNNFIGVNCILNYFADGT